MSTLSAAQQDNAATNVLHAVAKTHPGNMRHLNEDAVLALVRPADEAINAALLIVADGMGGHQAGEVASQLAVETVRDYLAWLINVPAESKNGKRPAIPPSLPLLKLGEMEVYPPPSYLERHMQAAISKANQAIYQYAKTHLNEAANLGTTLTGALVVGNEAIVVNVGDSRTYMLRDGELFMLTEDHSYISQLVQLGHVPPEAVYDHPHRHLITRSLGHEEDVKADIRTYTLQSDDVLLVCSDGLWEMIRDSAEIHAILSNYPIEEAAERLVACANDYGGHDNISVVLAKLQA